MTAKEYLYTLIPIFDKDYHLPTTSSKGAVVVETRGFRDFGLIVKNHLHFLPKDYGLTVMHSDSNSSYIKNELAGITGVNYINLGNTHLSSVAYNYLLTSDYFWNSIPYKKVLVFQVDSLLLREGVYLFEGYDYVGAPWIHIGNQVGNGGLSLRSKDVMLNIIKGEPYVPSKHGNEDLYFSRLIQEYGGMIAAFEIAQHFSVETIFYDLPIGVHACDKWLKKDQLKTIYNNSINELFGNANH